MNYKQDIFYNVDKISLETKISIINDAFAVNTEWWVDDLPGYQRRKIDMSFEDIMKKFNNGCHFVFIHRRGYNEYKWYGEVGFCTMFGKSYYLFIHVTEDDLLKIVEKYKLEVKY